MRRLRQISPIAVPASACLSAKATCSSVKRFFGILGTPPFEDHARNLAAGSDRMRVRTRGGGGQVCVSKFRSDSKEAVEHFPPVAIARLEEAKAASTFNHLTMTRGGAPA
jgi:hypothetical protein